MGVCNCSMFCCTLHYVHSSIAIILMGKREMIALLYVSSWCLVMVERLFLAVPRGCLQFVIVVSPDHTHLLFLKILLAVSFYEVLFSTNISIAISLNVQNMILISIPYWLSPFFCILNYQDILCTIS